MTIDKQQLHKLLWAEAASFRADCADWKRNTEALDEFLGEKTVEEVALEQLDSLYEYMAVRLTLANAKNDPEIIDEVARLLITVKSGWDAIAPQ